MGLHSFGKNEVLDALIARYGTLYVALLTVAPVPSDTGSTITEPTSAQYNGYVRKTITPATTFSAAAVGGTKTNTAGVTFATSTGGASSPVTPSFFALCTSSSGGNVVGSGRITSPVPVAGGQTPEFPAGALTLTAVDA